MPPVLKFCAWNLTLTSAAPIPPGTPVRGCHYTSDGFPDEPLPIAAKPDATNGNRLELRFPSSALTDGERTGKITLELQGYKPIQFRCDIPPVGASEGVPVHVDGHPDHHPGIDPYPLPNCEPSTAPFPPESHRGPLPPWDSSDSFGEVHTVPPPDLVIPADRDVLFMRADFNGVTLDANRWGDPPMLVGANSTPVTMLMTPMLALYPRNWQDACLTEHAERGYTHFVWDPHPWNTEENGRTFSLDEAVAWARYLKSWGFFSTVWSGQPSADDPMWAALADAGLIDFAIIGEEADGKFTAEAYDALLRSLLSGPLNGIPAAAHFTSNYPEGFPRDTMITNWADFDGRLHLCWQANQNDSAGKRGAMLYYARRRVNLGQVGGDGRPAPNSRVYDFENQASNQLYGRCDEDRGNLQSLEDLYCTAPDAGVRPMSGFGNGCRNHDGSVT